jgi:hypothetical protein
LIFGELRKNKRALDGRGKKENTNYKKNVIFALDAMFSWPKMLNEKFAPTQVNISRCVFNFVIIVDVKI